MDIDKDMSKTQITRKQAERVFEYSARCFWTSRNAYTNQEVTSVVDVTDIKFTWMRHKTAKMVEMEPNVFVFVVNMPNGYDRYEIRCTAMCE